MGRDTLFISHAAPEDNEFAIWLASRLELFGYKVWVDKEDLLGGEIFWNEIERVISTTAGKVLLVYSTNLLRKDGSQLIKTGIETELKMVSQTISENPDLIDFLILLQIDNSSSNLFPGADESNKVYFNHNWAEGLRQIIKKLEKDNFPKNNSKPLFSSWYLNRGIFDNPIRDKKELYYSNWWRFKHIPERFFVVRFQTESQAEVVYQENRDKIIIRASNCLIAFDDELSFFITDQDTLIQPIEMHPVNTLEVVSGDIKDSFASQLELENYLKRLLKYSLHRMFRVRGMRWYELSGKNLCYFYPVSSLANGKVKFIYPFRRNKKSKAKALFGKYLEIGNWHFAISLKPILTPFVGFSLKSHLVFTSDGFNPLTDPTKNHSYRRKKGKRMFNEDWRDLLLAFLASLNNSDGRTIFNVSGTEEIELDQRVEMFWSDVGYFDPKDSERQGLFIYNESEEEFDGEEI